MQVTSSDREARPSINICTTGTGGPSHLPAELLAAPVQPTFPATAAPPRGAGCLWSPFTVCPLTHVPWEQECLYHITHKKSLVTTLTSMLMINLKKKKQKTLTEVPAATLFTPLVAVPTRSLTPWRKATSGPQGSERLLYFSTDYTSASRPHPSPSEIVNKV